MADALRVGVIGMGTVGTGVAQVLLEQGDRLARRAGRRLELRRCVVRDLARPRDIDLPPGLLTDDVRKVIDDPEIDIAVELMGGVETARTVMRDLLRAGKHVVTANKALLCQHGLELFAVAREHGRTIAFEAAVAGGIPIIATVAQCLTANQLTSLSAILNGTSNFILTQMTQHNQAYAEALRQAQELGYAEADPTLDVDGTDAAQKLVLLTMLGFGTRVALEDFPRLGIDKLELADLKYAGELKYTIKLLAVARLSHGELEMHVSPTLVRRDRPLAGVSGPFNAIQLTGDIVGETWYSGRGAGRMPTASAVVADLVDIAAGRAQLTFERLRLWEPQQTFKLLPRDQSPSRYYLRFNVEDRPHVLADIADILGRRQISIASVIQHEAPEEQSGEASVPLVIMTHRTTAGALQAAEEELVKLRALRPPLVKLRVAD